jgi:protease-4
MRTLHVSTFVLPALLLAGGVAHAEPLPTSAANVVLPDRSRVTDDTSQAVVLNPANLAWLPGWEFRWTYIHCSDDVVKVGCGNAVEAATPLPFGLAAAARVELVQPPWGGPETEGVGFPYRGTDYAWVTLALAGKIGEHIAFGASLGRSYSTNGFVDGLWGLTAAASWRPDTHLAFSVIAKDFNRPSEQTVRGPNGFPCTTIDTECFPVLDGQFVMGVAVRPTGRREFEVGVEAEYWEAALAGAGRWTDRITLGVDIPYVGRLYGALDSYFPGDNRNGLVGTAGLELHYDGLSLGGGMQVGNGLGSNSTVDEYATASIAGYAQPGIPQPAGAVFIRLESTPSVRDHVALLRKLWRIAEDRQIDAVTLVLRAEPADSFAHAEELADALRVIRAHHKKVLCSVEDAGAKSLFVCANADRTVVQPAGGVRYAGLKAQYIYLKGLLDKLGIKAEFIRVGPHKSAPEQFTNEHAGPVAAEDHAEMLLQQEAVFVKNESLYRHMTPEQVRAATLKGPFIAREAIEAGFVDGTAFDDELEHATQELVGRRVSYVKYDPEPRAPRTFEGRSRIGLLYLDGDIIDGRSNTVPLLDMRMVGSYSMVESIHELRDDPAVKAVVLRIESPGGSSLASDVMWRALVELGKKKPLIISMGTIAASGGYYVASASKDIFALPLTITGSIGVFYGKADISGLLSKIGVTVDTYKTTPRADAESLYRGFTPDEVRELTRKVDQFYDTFLDRVSAGRGMTREQVDAVGKGRVWTGQQALERHLVDHLGGLREALEAARAAAFLPKDAPIEELPRESASLLEKAIGAVVTASAGPALAKLPEPIQRIGRAVAPLVVFRSDEALARIEWVEAEE